MSAKTFWRLVVVGVAFWFGVYNGEQHPPVFHVVEKQP